MTRFIGLDVHKRVVEVCILDADGKVLKRHRFDLDRETLKAFASLYLTSQDRVVLEATTNTWAVVRLLRPYVADIVVSNPLQTKAIASAKIKTDKVDAYVLAQLLRCDFLPTVWTPDEETERLRRLTSRRASLTSDATRVKNRIHSVLAQRLILHPPGKLFSIEGRNWLQQVALDDEGRQSVDSDLRLLGAIEREIAKLDDLFDRKAFDDPRVKLVMTLPGVDVYVALTVLAVLGDINRFRDGDHAASYFGLVPRTRQSAARCYHGPITKAGNGQGRWMLIQAAHNFRNHPGPLGVFFRRLTKRKTYNVAVTATARKMVVIIWHMLMNNEPYRYAKPDSTVRKLRRVRVKFTGRRQPKRTATGQIASRHGKVRTLTEVYQDEGLPPVQPLRNGEQRMLSACDVTEYARTINQQ